MSEQIQNIGIDLIDDPQAPMRSGMDDEKLDELANSIKVHGLIQPITLRKVGARYEVIAGHRRFKASKRAGMPLVASIVRMLDDAKTDELRMAENLYREDVNPVDEARYIRRMIDVHACEPAQLASMTGKSEAYLRGRYEILDFPPYLVEAVEKGELGLTAAQWLERITDETIRREYTLFAVRQGLTGARARAWYESWKAGTLPREAHTYHAPETQTSAEPIPIYDVCVLCRMREDITKMRMHYGHADCVDAAAKAAQ